MSKGFNVIECAKNWSTKVKYISGKWFWRLTNEPIKDINHTITRYSNTDANQTKRIVDTLINYLEPDERTGPWPPLILEQEAKAATGPLPPLPIELTREKLIILNYLHFQPNQEAMFILIGPGGTGKSTFLNVIRQTFDDDASALSLADMKNRFNLDTLMSHRINACDEIGSDIIDTPVIKQIVSNQTIQVDVKNRVPYQAKPQTKLIFSGNKFPRFDLSDTGMMRRIRVFEMKEVIQNPDRELNCRTFTHAERVVILRHALAVNMDDWRETFDNDTHKYLCKDNSVYICHAATYSEYKDKCRTLNLKCYDEPKWQELKELIFNIWKLD